MHYAESGIQLGLFYDYNTSGKGVAKNGPKKKPFFKFWEQFASKFWKLFTVNLIYFLFSGFLFVYAAFLLAGQTLNNYFLLLALPVFVLFGPSTAAVMQVMRKFTLEKPIFLFDEFKNAFKNNFRQALPVGIFDILFFVLFFYGINFYANVADSDPSAGNLAMLVVTTAIAVYVFMAHFYIYLEIVSLTLPLGKIIKNSLLLTIMGIKVNIINFVVTASFFLVIYLSLPYSTLVLPFLPFGWIMFLYAFNCYPVIQKYIINPYYESKGMRNPELPDEENNEEKIFTDRGGSEEEIRKKSQAKGIGKIIR